VVLLREGRVFADGDKPSLFEAGRLSELFGLPLELAERDGYYHLW
jgi:iron complex transport system ATP-binding protein